MESKIKKLQSELNEEKNKNLYLSKENAQLKQQIIEWKNQISSNDNIQKINNNLFNENYQLKQQINQLQKQINSNNNISNNQNSMDSFIKLIKNKEDIINDLNEKLKRFPFILEKNEKLMSVIFSSVNQQINYSIVCKNTDSIYKLEEELYKEYPDLFERRNYIFLSKGNLINKYQTFESNHIKNGDTIILNSNDD